MALVECPICNKRISSLAAECSHCQTDLTQLTDEQKKARRGIATLKKQQRLMTQSFLAMLVFCAGVLAFLLGDHQSYPWLPLAAQIVGVIGLVWYLVLRIFMVVHKVKKYRQ